MAGETHQLKITNPARIIRIFDKICQSRLYVFLRSDPSSSVVVKGRAESLQNFEGEDGKEISGFLVSELSEKGMKHLLSKEKMQIEFVMTSAKIICLGYILRIRKGQVIFSLPTSVASVERRENVRYKTTTTMTGFVKLSLWQPNPSDYLSAPIFPHHKNISGLLPLVDIGLGGICIKSIFPSPAQFIEKDKIDSEAEFFLPMNKPFILPIQFRWVKLIREHLHEDQNRNIPFSYHLFGCQFMKQSSEKFEKFIRQIIESEAI